MFQMPYVVFAHLQNCNCTNQWTKSSCSFSFILQDDMTHGKFTNHLFTKLHTINWNESFFSLECFWIARTHVCARAQPIAIIVAYVLSKNMYIWVIKFQFEWQTTIYYVHYYYLGGQNERLDKRYTNVDYVWSPCQNWSDRLKISMNANPLAFNFMLVA